MADHDDNAAPRLYAPADPHHVRALDAFETFYRQIGRVVSLAQVFETALRTSSASWSVMAAAELNQAWALLDARLDMLEAVTNDDAGRELWTLPTMCLALDTSRKVLALGVRYVSTHDHGAGPLLMQLKQLGARLEVHARIASEISVAAIGTRASAAVGGLVLSATAFRVANERTLPPNGASRCRVRRPPRRRRHLSDLTPRNPRSSEAS